MTTLMLLFTFGTLWFWISSIVLFLLITSLVESEHGFLATVCIVASVLLMSHYSGWALLTALKLHPLNVIGWIVGYLATGVLWSMAKWYFFLRGKINEYNNAKAEFLEDEGLKELTPETATKFFNRIRFSDTSAEPPSAKDNKKRLTRWISYWPFSIIGTLLNDFVRKVYDHIYHYCQKTYQRISEIVFEDAAKDVELYKQAKK